MQKIIRPNSFPTNLKRFPQDTSIWRCVRLKKPTFCSYEHSFSPIINTDIVLEISAAPEYFGTVFIRLLRKINKSGVHDSRVGQIPTRKPLFFIFFNKWMKMVPKYSGITDISKTVTGLLIGEKL